MKLIKELDNIRYFFDEENKIFVTEWKDGNEYITDELIKNITLESARLTVALKPTYYLGADTKRAFAYAVEIQNWVAQTLAAACIQANVKKFAVAMPTDFVSELSTQQTGEEAGELPFELQYFKNKEDALAWFSE